MSTSTNYLEAVVGMQPRLPIQPQRDAASALPSEESAPAPLHPPVSLPRNGLGEEVSPEFLAELHSYIQQTVSATVTEGLKTLIPEVIELALAQTRQTQAATAMELGQPQPHTAIVSPASQPALEQYVPPVATLPTSQSYRPATPFSFWASWASVFGIVAVMASIVIYTMGQTPQASTERVVNEQSSQLEQKDQLIQDLAEAAARPKECRAFCF